MIEERLSIIICKRFGVEDFILKSRKIELVTARAAYVYLMKKNTALTLEAIAKTLNSKHDHAINALIKAKKLYVDCADFKLKILASQEDLNKYVSRQEKRYNNFNQRFYPGRL